MPALELLGLYALRAMNAFDGGELVASNGCWRLPLLMALFAESPPLRRNTWFPQRIRRAIASAPIFEQPFPEVPLLPLRIRFKSPWMPKRTLDHGTDWS